MVLSIIAIIFCKLRHSVLYKFKKDFFKLLKRLYACPFCFLHFYFLLRSLTYLLYGL